MKMFKTQVALGSDEYFILYILLQVEVQNFEMNKTIIPQKFTQFHGDFAYGF